MNETIYECKTQLEEIQNKAIAYMNDDYTPTNKKEEQYILSILDDMYSDEPETEFHLVHLDENTKEIK